VRDTIEGYPGVDRSLQSYLRDKVSEVLTGSGNAIVVRIHGQKREILREKAEEVRQALAGIKGIVDLRAEGQVEEPQVHVKVDLQKAGGASVKPGDVRRAASNVFSGITVGFLFEEQKIYDVVVWGAPETRKSVYDLRDLPVEKPDRRHVRLGDVADISIVSTPTLIRHESIAPYVDVVANVSGRDLGSVASEVDRKLSAVKFPLEYHARLLGEYAERQDTQRRMLGMVLAAVIGIFLLLQACFRSWRLALVAFVALPASIAGGVLAALASGGGVSLGSLVGYLAVLGIAARSSLFLIRHYQHLELEQGMPFGAQLVLRGTREQLSSTLGSAAAIIAALLPILVLGQAPGLEILQPTAVVIIGGLIASTLVTLFVIPALYVVLAARGQRTEELGLDART
jgi:Cu/Ag efflux pump CusA